MSILKAALFAICFLLTSCGARFAQPPTLPPSLCTTVERAPQMPDGASIVQPVTEEEKTATGLFLGWVAEILRSDDRNADRAERAAKAGCK